MSKKKLTALGAYIFAGGFTLGVRKHFDVVAHFEEGPFGVATVQRNLPKLAIYQDRATWPLKEFAGKVDYMYANPPCAPWSIANTPVINGEAKPVHWSQNPLSTCWRHTANLVWQLRPKVAHIESVRPIYTKGRSMLEEIAVEAFEHGYQANVLLENALDCNLPQHRPRFVLCLTQLEYVPSPTRGVEIFAGQALGEYRAVTRRDKIKGDNDRLPPNFKNTIEGKLIKHVKPGERMNRVFDRVFPDAPVVNGKVSGRTSFLKYRLHPDKPSPTQLGGASLFHHKEDRYLTIGEASWLCGYPADYQFTGSISAAFAQMGKAVLPPVGEHLAFDAKRTISKGRKLKRSELKQSREITIYKDKVEERYINWSTGEKREPVPMDLPFDPDPKPRKVKIIQTSGSADPIKTNIRFKPLRVVGIGYYMRSLITKGASDDKVLLEAKKKFPTSKATIADVRWNRGHLKEGGKFFGEEHK